MTALADVLNRDCACIGVDETRLRDELARTADDADFYRALIDSRPHLYAASIVFVSSAQVQRMQDVITAIERVVALPAYAEAVRAWAPPIAAYAPGAHGVFLGYDFHLDSHGPRLIEINTNAGGGLLNLVLARAQRACCPEATPFSPLRQHDEASVVEMFRHEWRRSRGAAPLTRIAIVDDAPREQYLYPEFLLFERLFRRHGVDAVIADARELAVRDHALWLGDRRIDLVYNRLTDFALSDAAHAALRAAYTAGDVVVTPHPRAHALYADKRNLALLTDHTRLRTLGADDDTARTLCDGIAHTTLVDPSDAETLWARRRELFFKPVAGYGGKGAYRGDKLTKRVFEEILRSRYVAQALIPPSARRAAAGGEAAYLKLDVRNYVYDGAVQNLAARLYQGQTTNFRTPGGGFAPVFVVHESASAVAGAACRAASERSHG